MQVDRRLIISNLPKKGFLREEASHHTYFYHEYMGKRTGAYTYVSRGSDYKSYSDALLDRVKKELRLNSKRDVVNLVSCPMTGQEYVQILKDKNVLQ